MKTLYLCGCGNPEGVRLALNINKQQSRWDQIILLDDDASTHGKSILGIKVTGAFELLKKANSENFEVANLVARTTAKRWSAQQKIADFGLPFATLIHPSVDLMGVTFENDITVYQNVTVAAGAFVDKASVVLMGAIVGHGCRIGKGCIVAPGAVINARVQIGDGVYVGTNSSILPDLKIESWATIGIGSAVIEGVPEGATVMGVPAQILTISKEELGQASHPKTKHEKTKLADEYLPSTTFVETGIADLQVENQSISVEASAVEAVLVQHPAIQMAAVLSKQNEQLKSRKIAYIKYNSHHIPTVTELRDFIKEKLPDYAIPSEFIILDSFPLSADGTVDRKKLLEIDNASLETKENIAPNSSMEILIANIWQEVLSLPEVGIQDNFFDLGGDSLSSMRVINQIEKKIGIRINPKEFVFQTLGQLTAVCEQKSLRKTPSQFKNMLHKVFNN